MCTKELIKIVTIKDIAKIAGVSHSTVSRSLNDSSEISQKTKDKIKKIADELGFEFNNNARSLSTRKTGTIGVIFDNSFDQENSSLFFSKLLKEIRYSLEKEGLDMILDFRINPFNKKNNIKKLINTKKIDAFIIADEYLTDEDIKFILDKEIPSIFVHKKPCFDKKYSADFVLTDHFYGGYLATRFLIGQQHKNIITFTHKYFGKEYSEFEERTKGFLKAMEESNLLADESIVYREEISFAYGRSKIKELVRTGKEFTAVFAQTDLVALGVIRGLDEIGLKVPQDVSVIGYDNIEFSKFSNPELTTINQPVEKLAKKAVELLMNKLKRKSKKISKVVGETIIIEPDLIIRNSVGRS